MFIMMASGCFLDTILFGMSYYDVNVYMVISGCFFDM